MKDLLRYAMDIGEQMLICGAEVHRVEDSVTRICRAFGATRVNVFIITSSIVVTVYTADEESYTQTRRIMGTGTDMERLHRLNQLSREICSKEMTLEELREKYEECINCKTYPVWFVILCHSLIAAVFTAFFGGTLRDTLVSPIIGFITSILTMYSDRLNVNKILEKFICSYIVTAFAFIFMKVNFIASVDKVIIGNIMTLIPGIGLTNALRDLFVGDSIAGILRSVEAALLALAIGAGYFLFVWTLGGVFI